jgi:diguanylate cyclase (GGDEF)-like protein
MVAERIGAKDRVLWAVVGRQRRLLYPLLGVVIALFAPLGLLVVRTIERSAAISTEWLGAEIVESAATYAYVALSTIIAGVVIGYILGAKEDVLVELSTTDALTGLFNRRYFELRLLQEVDRSRRYGIPVCVVLIDVDRLKSINDNDGHDAGDRALCAVGNAIRANLRATDIAARWGGDEFALLLPQTSARDASPLIQRIRTSLASGSISAGVADNRSFHRVITCVDLKVGAPLIEDSETEVREVAAALIAHADLALYQAKNSGRNRVTAYSAASVSTSNGPAHSPSNVSGPLGKSGVFFQARINSR